MAREKFLKITLKGKGISHLRASVCYFAGCGCPWEILRSLYTFPLGSLANYASVIQQPYLISHANTKIQAIIREEEGAAENLRASRYELGPLSFILNHFSIRQNIASKKFLTGHHFDGKQFKDPRIKWSKMQAGSETIFSSEFDLCAAAGLSRGGSTC